MAARAFYSFGPCRFLKALKVTRLEYGIVATERSALGIHSLPYSITPPVNGIDPARHGRFGKYHVSPLIFSVGWFD